MATLLAVPTVLVRMPPMVDFPAHEAVVAVLARWRDHAFLGGELYDINFGHPNQLQYLLALPFAWLFGPTKGLEIAAAIAVASILLGTARLAEHLGRPRWSALCVSSIAVGWNYQWGLIANLLGIGALLFALPSLDRFTRAPTWRGVGVACVWMLLLYEAHEVSMVVACVAVVLFVVWPWATTRAAMSAIPCAFAVVLALVQLRLQHLTSLNQQFMLVPRTFLQRVLTIPGVIVGFPGEPETTVMAFVLCLLPVGAAAALRTRADVGESPALSGEASRTAPYWALACVLVVAYFVLPASYGGVFYFSDRFLPVAWPLLVVLAFGRGDTGARVLRGAALAIPVGVCLVYFPAFRASDAVYGELDTLIPSLEGRSSYISIELDSVARGAVAAGGYSTRNAHGHMMANKGGRTLHDYTQSPISLALIRADKRWDVATDDAFLDVLSIRPRAVFSRFRYLALHSTSPAHHVAAARALAPVATRIAASSEWSIFESNILTVGVADPEGAYLKKKGPTLRELLRVALAEMRSEGGSRRASPDDGAGGVDPSSRSDGGLLPPGR